MMSPPQLPSEIWNHVFACLPVADKLSVRACCRLFKKLVDHGSLWRDWTVVLTFRNGPYNGRFWASLRRRRVASAAVRSGRAKDWDELALGLPGLTTLIMERSSQESLGCVKRFPHLRRLVIRSSRACLALDASAVSDPLRLTHLSMCGVKLHNASIHALVSAVSPFKNLTSLVCHQIGIVETPVRMISYTLACLPKLKHLSLSTVHVLHIPHNPPRPKPRPLGVHGLDGVQALSSLELINCRDHSLPMDAMRLVPGLQTLTVFYQNSYQESAEVWPPVCHLKTWLCDLPQLTTLAIVKGPPVDQYVGSIPATVTSLTLRVADISSEMMAAVAARVPDLLHLHVDPWPSHLGALTAQIPHLFPKLKSLKVRHEHVPEKVFLHLHKLQELKCLEILDSGPHLSELIGKLQTLTNYRLQVTTSRHRDVLACACDCQVY